MDVANIPVVIIIGHVEGWWTAKGSDVATRCGGGATQSHNLSTGHSNGARAAIVSEVQLADRVRRLHAHARRSQQQAGTSVFFCSYHSFAYLARALYATW